VPHATIGQEEFSFRSRATSAGLPTQITLSLSNSQLSAFGISIPRLISTSNVSFGSGESEVEPGDVLADRALRDPQDLGGAREITVPDGNDESAQGIERDVGRLHFEHGAFQSFAPPLAPHPGGTGMIDGHGACRHTRG
jgi:hypothetical protein